MMASHGCPPGNGLVLVHEQDRVFKIKDLQFQPYVPSLGARHEIKGPNSVTMEPWRSSSGFFYQLSQLHTIKSPVGRPILAGVQDAYPDSLLFSSGIAEQCIKHEKILKLLRSGLNDLDKGGSDLSLLADLMDLRALTWTPPIYSDCTCTAPEPIVHFVGDMTCSSKFTVYPDGRVLFSGSGTEAKEILSVSAEFYSSRTYTAKSKQSILVPQFSWMYTSEAQANVLCSSLDVKDVAAPLKSRERIKLRPSPNEKKGKKRNTERDLYQRNYFHACESLLSFMMDKQQHRKMAILPLKKSVHELSSLLTQFSACIAGTGLAVILCVVCKVACGGVPLCLTGLFSTGLGVGLIWLSSAVNGLRNTILYISKNGHKVGLKDEEMSRSLDKSLKNLYFRAATVMVAAALMLV